MAMHSDVRLMIGRMLLELFEGPCTVDELIAASGLADSTVREWLRDLRACAGKGKPGAIRICAYDAIRNGQVVKPIYELNPDAKPDAKRPPKKPGADRAARYRLRQRLRAAGASEATVRALGAALR